MAHIVDFKVGGLAGRRDVYSQKLNPDVNIFFGPNGSGKTSLLKIFDSAFSRESSLLRTVPFEWAEVTIHSIDYDKDFVQSIQKVKTSGRPQRKSRETVEPVQLRASAKYMLDERGSYVEEEPLVWGYKPKLPKDVRQGQGWAHTYLPTWRLYVGSEYYPRAVTRYREQGVLVTERSEYDWDIMFAKSLEVLWSRYTNELLSEVQMIQGQGLVDILLGILATKPSSSKKRQLDSEEAYQRVSAFFARQGRQAGLGSVKKFVDRYTTDGQLRKVVHDINRVEQRIEKAMASRNRLEELIRDMFSGGKQAVFKDTGIEVITDSGKDIGLASLSSGEKHVLTIFIETLLAQESTLIIDEPEISLHIDWQTRLVSAINQLNPDTQLIVATHSPEIMAEMPDDKIFRL